MNPELSNCPNCGAKLKGGFLSSITLLEEQKVSLINYFSEKKAPFYCSKCGDELYSKYKHQLIDQRSALKSKMQNIIHYIPVISAQNPLNWEYDILWMVTGQSTTGTGVFSEFTSSFTRLVF
jgi:hypothetical protein